MNSAASAKSPRVLRNSAENSGLAGRLKPVWYATGGNGRRVVFVVTGESRLSGPEIRSHAPERHGASVLEFRAGRGCNPHAPSRFPALSASAATRSGQTSAAVVGECLFDFLTRVHDERPVLNHRLPAVVLCPPD